MCHPLGIAGLDEVAVDVGLVAEVGGVEETLPIRQERRLVVVAIAIGDVDRGTEGESPTLPEQGDEVDIGPRRGRGRGLRVRCGWEVQRGDQENGE